MNQGPRQRGIGTIGVLSNELTRYADFSIALVHHQTPPGTKLIWTKGVDVVGNMNRMVSGMQGDWLWILGDDHVFDFDLLNRLLAHDVDIVVPLCLKRTPPYDPVVYSGQNDLDEYVGYTDLPSEGLVEVHAAGSAGMLIRRHVLDAIPDPVFEAYGGLNEDLTFCRKAREAGFTIWCDVEARLGHIGILAVWPLYEDGQWKIQLQLGNGQNMTLNRYVREPVLA